MLVNILFWSQNTKDIRKSVDAVAFAVENVQFGKLL